MNKKIIEIKNIFFIKFIFFIVITSYKFVFSSNSFSKLLIKKINLNNYSINLFGTKLFKSIKYFVIFICFSVNFSLL